MISIENFHDWSWSCTLTELMAYFNPPYRPMERTVIDVKHQINTKLLDLHELVLFQNVDSCEFLTPEIARRSIMRIGGIAMSGVKPIECTKYDDGLSSVGAIISTNKALHDLAARNNPNSHVIANGVDLTKFKPTATPRTGKFRIGFSGNISCAEYMRYKGWALLAGVCDELFDVVTLVAALYGHQQIAHKRMVEDFYQRVDCVILPSEDEGCSNTITEALACGVPVICTKVGYHGETLTDGLNCLFIERDVVSMREAIERLINEPDLCARLAQNGRAFAVAHHDIRVIAKQYESVFETVLNR